MQNTEEQIRPVTKAHKLVRSASKGTLSSYENIKHTELSAKVKEITNKPETVREFKKNIDQCIFSTKLCHIVLRNLSSSKPNSQTNLLGGVAKKLGSPKKSIVSNQNFMNKIPSQKKIETAKEIHKEKLNEKQPPEIIKIEIHKEETHKDQNYKKDGFLKEKHKEEKLPPNAKMLANHKRHKSEQNIKQPSKLQNDGNSKGKGTGSRLTSRRCSNTGADPVIILDMIETNSEMITATGTHENEGSTDHNLTKEQIIENNKGYVKKHHEIPPTSLDNYKFVKLIGKGAFGKVTLGIHKLTGKYVAIKTIEKSQMKDDFSRKKVFREVYILKKIRHGNVIRLLEVFESQKHLLIVMEHAGGGDLLQYIKKKKRLTEDEAKNIFREIVYGLGHIHSRSVLHRDIKLDNMLLDSDKHVKICDFGVSKIMNKGTGTIKEQCGTPAYIAPEIISEEGYSGFYADYWSLGVLLYAMLTGTVPFKAGNMKDLHSMIQKCEYTIPEYLTKGILMRKL